ncbi:MAG: YceI family protein [Bacteroidales bacterium]|nr:YceI family protein [Bacteroidales bacterium]
MKTFRNLLFAFATIFLFSEASIAQTNTVDLNENSGTVEWEGKKIGGSHNGEIDIKDGQLTFNNKELTKAHIVIDMSSIVNHDLEDQESNQKLVGHLKSDDFFGVKTYPEATFKSTSIAPKGSGKYMVTGNMTIKGTTNPVEFPLEMNTSKKAFSAEGTFKIDRSKYDVRYGSRSFFDNLGDKAIYDDFEISFKISGSY